MHRESHEKNKKLKEEESNLISEDDEQVTSIINESFHDEGEDNFNFSIYQEILNPQIDSLKNPTPPLSFCTSPFLPTHIPRKPTPIPNHTFSREGLNSEQDVSAASSIARAQQSLRKLKQEEEEKGFKNIKRYKQ